MSFSIVPVITDSAATALVPLPTPASLLTASNAAATPFTSLPKAAPLTSLTA